MRKTIHGLSSIQAAALRGRVDVMVCELIEMAYAGLQRPSPGAASRIHRLKALYFRLVDQERYALVQESRALADDVRWPRFGQDWR